MKEPKVMLVSAFLLLGAVDAAFTSPAFLRPTLTSTPRSHIYMEKETMKFVANVSTTSSPLDVVWKDEIYVFLTSNTCRDHFLSAGGNNRVNEELLDSELERFWIEACTKYYGAELLPEEGDAVVSSESVIQFPGLKMMNVVFNGVKLVDNGTFPAYQAVLIAERKRVSGSPPVVWLFNRLTGHNAEKEDTLSSPSAKATSYISVSETELGHCFTLDCSVEVTIEFPKLLVKILPTSKEKAEEQGSLSVKQAVEKDVAKAIKSVNDAFNKWQAVSAET